MGAVPVISALILAAGSSTRMGRAKALLPIGPDREPFVVRLCRTLRAASLDHIFVVLGPESDIGGAVRAAIERAVPDVRTVVNEAPGRGQLSSLLVGLDALDRAGKPDAALVALVDAPLVSVATVRAVVDAFARTRAPIVRPAAGERHGHPVLFARRVFDELRRADPAAGAKAVVRAHAAEICNVPVDDPGAFHDIDTPDDYRDAIGSDSGT